MRPGPRPPRNPLGRPAVTRHDAGVRVLIVGCGYVGLPLGAELARRG
ncbi:MAG: hypothetical protein FD161_3799, partial [Limisphaerales bacterium]